MNRTSKKHSAVQTTDALIVIQAILAQWTKESRGGQKAGIRNQVPEALELPVLSANIPVPSYIVHGANYVLDYVPTPGGAPQTDIQPIATPYIADCIRVLFDDGVVHVDFNWWNQGMPERYPRRDALILQPGQWGRIRYNARRSPVYTAHCWDWGDWWYEKWVFNIALLTTYSPHIFLDTPPLLIYGQMADLW